MVESIGMRTTVSPSTFGVDGQAGINGAQNVTGTEGTQSAARAQAAEGLNDVAALPDRNRNVQTPPPGAPALEPPAEHFDMESIALVLGALQSKLSELQLGTAKEQVKLDQAKKDELHKEAIKKIEDAAKKLAEAASKRKLGFIFNIFSKIATLVAAVVATAVATAVTGGAATPLLVVALVGLGMAVMDVADSISQACGGPSLSVNALVGNLATLIAKELGADEDKAKQIGTWVGMGVQVALSIATVAVTFTNPAAAASVAAKTVTGITSLVQAGTSIAQGGIAIDAAKKESEAMQIQADKLDIDKLIKALQAKMEESAEEIRKVMKEIDEAMQNVSAIINGMGESRQQIARNMV